MRVFGHQKSLWLLKESLVTKTSWAHQKTLRSLKESSITERVFGHQKHRKLTKRVFCHQKHFRSLKESLVTKSIMSSPKEFSVTKSIFSHQRECGTMLAQSGNKGLSRSSYVVMLIDIVELLRELQAPMPLVRPKMVVRRPVIWNFVWPTKDSILTTPYT